MKSTKVEVNEQVASEEHDCDACPEKIPKGEGYVRVSSIRDRASERRGRPHGAKEVEKFHLKCWMEL